MNLLLLGGRRCHLRRWPAWALLLAAAALLLAAAGAAAAHTEGKMQLASAPAGPFKLTVWTSPDPARVGKLHVAAAVVLAEDASPILDAGVRVTLEPLGGGSVLTAPATAEDAANKFLYEAIFNVTEAGPYQVTVSVADAKGLTGQADFELAVQPAGGFGWLLLLPVGLGGVAVLLLWRALRPHSAG